METVFIRTRPKLAVGVIKVSRVHQTGQNILTFIDNIHIDNAINTLLYLVQP